MRRRALLVCSLAVSLVRSNAQSPNSSDPLPSWNDGASKQAILRFVAEVTGPGRPGFVPPDHRIATFDNDGTLWVEQPIPTELAFSFDRVRVLAAQHPEWRHKPPFDAVLAGDPNAPTTPKDGRGFTQLIVATHSGTTAEAFERVVEDWIRAARHPRFQRPYTQCVYQPMLELLRYLGANRFKTYIVSGGTTEFLRPWVEGVYGVPPEQTIGSSIKTEFELLHGLPVLMRLPEIDFINNGAGKPVGIEKFIGRRPIAAFGNSDGDQQMLEWTAAGKGPHLMLVVHHTDGAREYAYDRHSSSGTLDKVLDEAKDKSWVVVDMKRDWKTVFPKTAD